MWVLLIVDISIIIFSLIGEVVRGGTLSGKWGKSGVTMWAVWILKGSEILTKVLDRMTFLGGGLGFGGKPNIWEFKLIIWKCLMGLRIGLLGEGL